MSRVHRAGLTLPAIVPLLAAAAGCGAVEDSGAARSKAAANPAVLELGHRRLPTGVRLHYAARGDTAGPAVILLHGYSDSWFSFSRILPLLPSEYRVYALDQRGHGESDRPASGYRMAQLAEDVIAFMDVQRIPRAVVVGHSMGSFTAQYAAAMAPERVSGLVLVGAPSIHHISGGADAFAASIEPYTDSVPESFIAEFQASTIHRQVPDSFMARVVAESRKLPPHVWHGIMDGMLASGPASGLAGTTIPTLVIWGERDAIFGRGAQDSLLALIPGAELEVYPATGHAPHWEQPDAVSRDIGRFVHRVAATGMP